MKPGHVLSTIFALAAGVAVCQAQSFVSVTMIGTSTNSLAVPTNTLATLAGWYGQQSTVGYYSAPGAPRSFTLLLPVNASLPLPQYLGPCELTFESQTNSAFAGSYSRAVFRFENVSTAPAPSLVQPAGRAAVLRVETSTNLATWQTVTNATFPATEAHRFFRTTLVLP